MAVDSYDPWRNAHSPSQGELVIFIGYGPRQFARAIEVDAQRQRALVALDGERRWVWFSQVRQYVAETRGQGVASRPGYKKREQRVADRPGYKRENPQKRGRKTDAERALRNAVLN